MSAKTAYLLFLLIICVGFTIRAQDSSRLDKLVAFPDKLFNTLNKKSSRIESAIEKQTQAYLSKLAKQENKLRKRLFKKDSVLAKKLFDGVDEKYAALKQTSGKLGKYQNVYSGHLDSLSTAMNFLKTNQIQGLSDNPALRKTLSRYTALQEQLNASDKVTSYLAARRQFLKEQFEQLGMVKELRQFRKQVYYYQAQVNEYKASFEDPSKIEEKLLQLAKAIPEFKSFFASNSILGSLFPLTGGNPAGLGTTAAITPPGLQTRAMLTQALAERVGNGPNIIQALQQGGGGGDIQSQLAPLKDKLNLLKSGSIGNGKEDDLPNFKPNNQKTKSFLQRLEYGTYLQTTKTNNFFPATSDIGLSVGYRISDKSLIGLGASYKMGWGSDIRHINLSSQGLGFRSFADIKLKGSFFVSGGFEYNYQQPFASLQQLKYMDSWQQSGLVGISKILSLNTKMFKKTKLQFLWDFLSYQQRPVGQPIKFRIGYSF